MADFATPRDFDPDSVLFKERAPEAALNQNASFEISRGRGFKERITRGTVRLQITLFG
jgi:hypothetical protein